MNFERTAHDLPELSKSDLLGYAYQFLGFAYSTRPELPGLTVQWTFFSRLNGPSPLYIMCLSQHRGSVPNRDKELCRRMLGTTEDAANVAPYATRAVNFPNFAEFKHAMDSVLDFPVTWVWDKKVLDPCPGWVQPVVAPATLISARNSTNGGYAPVGGAGDTL